LVKIKAAVSRQLWIRDLGQNLPRVAGVVVLHLNSMGGAHRRDGQKHCGWKKRRECGQRGETWMAMGKEVLYWTLVGPVFTLTAERNP
jgi:hypothetical protein